MKHNLQRNLAGVALVTGLLLLVPLVAMQFTDEVSWGLLDFVAAGTLLFGAGVAGVAAVHRLQRRRERLLALAAIGLVGATVWAELAVGILH